MQILKTAMIGLVLISACTTKTGAGQMIPASNPLYTDKFPPDMSQPQIIQRLLQQKMLASERQKKLVEDTNKLLALTTALKEQVNESDKNVLSLEMIKKADQIEKLAHSLKERIKS